MSSILVLVTFLVRVLDNIADVLLVAESTTEPLPDELVKRSPDFVMEIVS